MPRSSAFHPERQPLRNHASLELVDSKVSGPLSFLNPTRAHFRHVDLTPDDEESSSDTNAVTRARDKREQPADTVEYKWTSRNNRKGRHALSVTPAQDPCSPKYAAPPSTSTFREVVKGIGRMFTQYPYWDVSYLVAVIFTWGSVVWVVNSFFVYLPLVWPETEFPNEVLTGGGVTAFIGATIFEIGSILLIIEAVNENRTSCFGWAVERVLSEHHLEKGGGYTRLRPDVNSCVHHHHNKKNLVAKSAPISSNSGEGMKKTADDARDGQNWVWFPSWHELRTHYLHELGFLACLSQLIGATIFWIAGYTALPGIINKMSPGLTDGIYWTPQVIGGTGFVVSGTLFMLETQKKWYLPAFDVLGWHIGFWNTVGGIGFTLCPAFGYDRHSWAQYQASLSTFWASWAFLIASVVQLYESLDKHPVDVEKPKNQS